MLSDWSIYLIVLHMIGQMTERLHDMTSNRMLLDVRVSPKKTIQQTSYFNYIVIKTYFTNNN